MENYTTSWIFIDRMTSSKTEIKLVNQSVGNFSELGGLFALNPKNPRVRCSIHRLATSSKTLAIKDLPSPKGSKQKPAKSGLFWVLLTLSNHGPTLVTPPCSVEPHVAPSNLPVDKGQCWPTRSDMFPFLSSVTHASKIEWETFSSAVL
jgi:hypothetical protein